MSLDISLYEKPEYLGAPEKEVMSMNWLRNPFGLARYMTDNARYLWSKNGNPPAEGEVTLNHVVNRWAYSASDEVDRGLFLKVVRRYHEAVLAENETYFFFDVSEYIWFVEPKASLIPKEEPTPFMKQIGYKAQFLGQFYEKYGCRRLAIPIRHFQRGFNLTASHKDIVAEYKAWCDQLLEFANLLQDENLTFFCSN